MQSAPERALFAAVIAACLAAGCAADELPASNSQSGDGSGMNSGDPTASVPVGVVTVRRLNRTEYSNTLRDLTGTAVRYGDNFPPENLSFGFDNIGEALTVQPLHFELYEQAAESVIDELFARPPGDTFLARTVPCDVAQRDCLLMVVRGFAERAFRRRVTEDEFMPFVSIAEAYVAAGGGVVDGLEFALRGVLLSPHFIYRVELDPDPTSSAVHPLTPFELASRLSYFLWSTMPDDPLFVVADTGTFGDDTSLASEVTRMLADGKARSLVDDFAGQWLNLRRLDQVKPDYATFPSFDDELRAAMRTESELLFAEILGQQKPLGELLTAGYTYVNARLAQHYGLPAPAGEGWARVELSDGARGGFLTQASFLTLTSNPTRTSPVKRGKWVLDQMLCSPPPPPPPGVDTSLAENDGEPVSLRERLAEHRASPACAGCHAAMDPIGLSFENFDGVGAYRTADAGGTIDASGVLPTDQGELPFAGPSELAQILVGDPRFDHCVTRQMLTYAIGRGYTSVDDAAVETVAARARANGGSLAAIIEAVVMSEAFRQRRAVAEEG